MSLLSVVSVVGFGIFLSIPSAAGTPTAASVLTCSPAAVTPGNNVTCIVAARDALEEPTGIDFPSEFIIRITTDVTGVTPVVGPLVIGPDTTIGTFTVACSQGSNVVVFVASPNGRPIRGSGFEALFYAWPPLYIGPLTCSASNLTLRSTVTCAVTALGANGVPAFVTASDVYLSEAHGDGTFAMLSGAGGLTFTFTAPNAQSVKYASFILRVALTGSVGDPRSISLPVLYPTLSPTVQTTLQCTTSDGVASCVVNSADNVGPVLFVPSAFTVSFDTSSSGMINAPSWTSTSLMSFQWTPPVGSQIASIGNLLATQTQPSNIFLCRMHVTVAGTSQEVSGSPYVFTSGVPPTAGDLTFIKCTRTYLIVGMSTTCYISVSPSVSAVARYVTLAIISGGGAVSAVQYVNGSLTSVASIQGMPALGFNYTAPSSIPSSSINVQISMLVQGTPINRSPLLIVVFPQTSLGTTAATVNRQPVIALGMCYFGACFTVGLMAFFKRQMRIKQVKSLRREKELMAAEMEAKLSVHVRPLSPAEKRDARPHRSNFADHAEDRP